MWWRSEVSVREVKRKERVKNRQIAAVIAEAKILNVEPELRIGPPPPFSLSVERAVRRFGIFVTLLANSINDCYFCACLYGCICP